MLCHGNCKAMQRRRRSSSMGAVHRQSAPLGTLQEAQRSGVRTAGRRGMSRSSTTRLPVTMVRGRDAAAERMLGLYDMSATPASSAAKASAGLAQAVWPPGLPAVIEAQAGSKTL